MARIRTIKPEFWTDETIVRLPFEARLLFIGMWNFADDSGALDYSPDRLRLQILPAESACDITALIDLLEACGLISYWVSEEGTQAISICNWAKHQKIDNPSKKTAIHEDYRKKAIPNEERIAVAKKYGCLPGMEADATCFYCGMPGRVKWWNTSNGKPSRWITLSELEFDHFVSEHSGGETNNKNIVLACRSCNRGKREFDPHQFFAKKNPSVTIASPSEKSPLDQGRDQGPKDQGGETPPAARASRLQIETLPDDWRAFCQQERSDLDPERTFAKFSDYWKAKPGKQGTKLDWLATWRNWVREERAANGNNGKEKFNVHAYTRSELAKSLAPEGVGAGPAQKVLPDVPPEIH